MARELGVSRQTLYTALNGEGRYASGHSVMGLGRTAGLVVECRKLSHIMISPLPSGAG